MTFLEPLLLYGLPLASVPILIHLFNRLRHRSLDWAAMMFLITANRKSTRYAKLRQWLILAMRTLAVLALIFVVSRPLAGGWLGWMLRPAPDVVLVVLDRSASMETKLNGGQITRRAEAVRLLSEAVKSFEGTSRLVLLDSALRTPQEMADAAALSQLSMAGPSDAGCDMPAVLQTALDWLQRNRPGSAEIWIASDMQRGNWRPDGDHWTALMAQFAALPQPVRIRLLTVGAGLATDNQTISVKEINRRFSGGSPRLEVVLDIERGSAAPVTLPLNVTVDGNKGFAEVNVPGQSFLYRHVITLDSPTARGWGKVELPADANLRDNTAFFVYGPPPPLKSAVVVAADNGSARFMQLAAAPSLADTNRLAEIIPVTRAGSVAWSDYSLVLWHAPLPSGDTARQLRAYLESGGVVLFFPAGETGRFEGASWGELEVVPEGKPWKITRWVEKDGPLARTEEGISLPLNELVIKKRQQVFGAKTPLASFEDGGIFMARQVLGSGAAIFCSTTPDRDWSDLADGMVLVPLTQRLLTQGGRRFTQADLLPCGEADGLAAWTPVEGRDIRTAAGIYRSGSRMVAVNVPEGELDVETLEAAKARTLFGNLPVQLFEEKGRGESRLQTELWRVFLFLMLAFLMVEAALILPAKEESAQEGVRP